MANSYITLTNSNSTVSKKFRVLQENYDDGTWNRAESVGHTIGGGIDHSYGGLFRTWSMLIKVRHTETESGYGDLEDLEYFYKLNNPSGTPNTTITLTDHHNNAYATQFVGNAPKSCLGCMIEGEYAWFIFKMQLMEVT